MLRWRFPQTCKPGKLETCGVPQQARTSHHLCRITSVGRSGRATLHWGSEGPRPTPTQPVPVRSMTCVTTLHIILILSFENNFFP
jgi:hypothetical protein